MNAEKMTKAELLKAFDGKTKSIGFSDFVALKNSDPLPRWSKLREDDLKIKCLRVLAAEIHRRKEQKKEARCHGERTYHVA